MCLCGMFLANTDLCVTDDTLEWFMTRHKERKWVGWRHSFAFSPQWPHLGGRCGQSVREASMRTGCGFLLLLPPATFMVGGGWGDVTG